MLKRHLSGRDPKMILQGKKTYAVDDLIIDYVDHAPAILPLFVPVTPAISESG